MGVLEKVAASYHREQQALLALLNLSIPATHPATESADIKGVTTQGDSGNDDLAVRVMNAIEDSKWDFRTPEGLAEELEVAEDEVRAALERLGDRVRRPIGATEEYRDWYRSSAKPRTRKERWWLFRALAGHTSPGV
ncbi:hypothetical protein [Pseudosporangium ferrugineum]|uniref:Uncharacterized protein n=1 Tax=Pseudosporangium ferrugineum TaxID=439699 RepID=A0A2T0R8W7_9ACTN|nr:hypothetical protein [Pseudosporangium ferrugineum]PRY17621.1 hypothetical protein CLV70_1521 [Pseudosporangium ferrugineum]